MSKAEQICSELKIQEVMTFYGIQFNNRGFANCPFHNEKTASLKTHDNHYKCFGCGASGGVIDFVMETFGITFQQAIIRLDNDFHLGLTSKRPTLRERAQEAENRRIEAVYQKWQGNLQEDYKTLCAVHLILFRRSLKGEEWLNKYLEKLSELLDTFDIEEVRKWQTIWQ
jgi:DNA primase